MTQTKGKTPKLQVEMTDEPEVRQETVPEDGEAAATHTEAEGVGTATISSSDASAADKASSRAERIASWFSRTFPGSEHAVFGGLIGLLAAILIFVVGIGKTLVVALMVLVGVTLGQCLDGNPRIVNAVRRVIEKYRSE